MAAPVRGALNGGLFRNDLLLLFSPNLTQSYTTLSSRPAGTERNNYFTTYAPALKGRRYIFRYCWAETPLYFRKAREK